MENDSKTDKPRTSLSAFCAELKRRKVMRVAITYAVVAWLIIQVASTTFASFGIPVWAFRFVVLMVILGFPLAIILAWAFELTPDGIKTTKHAREEQGEVPVSKNQERKRNWMAFAFAAAAPTLIFGALAIFFYFRADTPDSPLSAPSSVLLDTDNSIAVLPFANMSPDEENAFFADGVHEDVLTNLSHVRTFQVISRTSTLRYRDSMLSLSEIGKELGVRYLVEGSVRRVGNRVRITAQLIDASTDQHLWAQNYTRDLDDIFAIQTEIAKEIADKLETILSPEEVAQIERRPTDNLEAYDYVLKFRELQYQGTADGDQKIELLEKAVALDPNYSEAWAQLVIECVFWWDTAKGRNDPALLAKAHHALEEAKRTGPDLPYGHVAESILAFREYQDWELSIRHLLNAMVIYPNSREINANLGRAYYFSGRLAEAQHYYEAVLRLDPNSVDITGIGWLPTIYLKQGKRDEARAFIDRQAARTDVSEQWKSSWDLEIFNLTGDREAYFKTRALIPFSSKTQSGQSFDILYSRNHRTSLRLIENLSNRHFDSQYSICFGSKDLVTALLWFELGETQNCLDKVAEAKPHLQGLVDMNPLAQPWYWADLAICHALEGDRELMIQRIATTREVSNTDYWRFQQQAACEVLIAIAYLVLGENDQAIETLESATQMKSQLFISREIDCLFIFDRLRGNPRFDRLLED
ncbi:MAG: tetratricopeptide repeat protein [Verrucomicrobia bacterium]|nr:tetratricopeptide repeat protein [Verrucomicrobiota bacterium]MDA1066824.1 tetratricopeptide repeat protein [Verrucomicrobiota bacterium]